MALTRTTSLRASSLIETLAALTIISIAVGSGFMIYQNVLRTNRVHARQIAKMNSEKVIQHISDYSSTNKEFTLDNQYYSVKTSTSSYSNKCVIVQIEAKDSNGQLIYKTNKIIHAEQLEI